MLEFEDLLSQAAGMGTVNNCIGLSFCSLNSQVLGYWPQLQVMLLIIILQSLNSESMIFLVNIKLLEQDKCRAKVENCGKKRLSQKRSLGESVS